MAQALGWGYFLGFPVAIAPLDKRAVAFIDGQNLFFAARDAFGYKHPNYNVRSLAQAVCRLQGWRLVQARFYSGIPDQYHSFFWNMYWSRKLSAMGREGVHLSTRRLRYRKKEIVLPALARFGEMAGGPFSFVGGRRKASTSASPWMWSAWRTGGTTMWR